MANVGSRGFAPPGAKREGDLRTPSGSFGFDYFFGIDPNPGVRFPYREIYGRNIVWDDDSTSSRYNTWVDVRSQDPGASPEPMYVTPDYEYGAVMDYNAGQIPWLGSAIFLHVSAGAPTSGCVALRADELLQVLKWLDPNQQPRIIMGTRGSIQS